MNWNTSIVAADRLVTLLAAIRAASGTVTSSRPRPDGVHVTWTTTSELAGAPRQRA